MTYIEIHITSSVYRGIYCYSDVERALKFLTKVQAMDKLVSSDSKYKED